MGEQEKVSADQVLRGGKEDGEKLLGIDDESLRRGQADRRTTKEKAGGGISQRIRTFFAFWELWAGYEGEEADKEPREEDYQDEMRTVWWVVGLVLAALLMAVGGYLALNRSTDPTDALKNGGATATGGSTVGAPSSGQAANDRPRRWLIVADTPLHGKRPQFTIELKGEGKSGDAVWLEPPQATGSYTWNGDDLDVKLVITQTAAPGKTFPQHFEIQMKRLADGSLNGRMLSENWAYSSKTGLKLNGMVPWPAVGEPK
jgi:hypothetical protein